MMSENLTRSRRERKGLSIDLQVYCALHYFATAANLSVISDSLGLYKSTVSAAVSSVFEALCNEASSFIAFPDFPADLRKQAVGFPGLLTFQSLSGQSTVPDSDYKTHRRKKRHLFLALTGFMQSTYRL